MVSSSLFSYRLCSVVEKKMEDFGLRSCSKTKLYMRNSLGWGHALVVCLSLVRASMGSPYVVVPNLTCKALTNASKLVN